MSIGEKIQNIRRENKLTQEEFAEKLGVSRQAISKWELGESNPDIDKIVLISRLFNLSTDSILLGNADAESKKTEPDKTEESRIAKGSRKVFTFAKKHFYMVGYILIFVSVINLITYAILTVSWAGLSRELERFLMQYNISLDLRFLSWIFILLGLLAVITLIVGIIVACKAKKAFLPGGDQDD